MNETRSSSHSLLSDCEDWTMPGGFELFLDEHCESKNSPEKALSTLDSSSVNALSPPRLATCEKTDEDTDRTTPRALKGVGNLHDGFPIRLLRREASCSSNANEAVAW